MEKAAPRFPLKMSENPMSEEEIACFHKMKENLQRALSTRDVIDQREFLVCCEAMVKLIKAANKNPVSACKACATLIISSFGGAGHRNLVVGAKDVLELILQVQKGGVAADLGAFADRTRTPAVVYMKGTSTNSTSLLATWFCCDYYPNAYGKWPGYIDCLQKASKVKKNASQLITEIVG